MTDLEAEQVVIWYRTLEGQLETFLKAVPLSDKNHDTHLPLLAPLIVEAGSLIDTVFREELPNSTESRKRSNIEDFAVYFETTYNLSQVKSLLYQYPPIYITPIYSWTSTKTGKYSERKWWTVYNYIKHNRIKKHHLATLGTTIEIVCALQQVISVLPTFTRALWRHHLLDAPRNVHYVGQDVEESQIRYFGMVETELFATPTGYQRFPAEIDNLIPFHYGGKKLARFLGRM